MKIIKLYFIVFCTLFILPYSAVMAYEEANYEVISKNEVYEIRKYSNRLAVETMTSGIDCLLYTSPSPRDVHLSRMPSSA